LRVAELRPLFETPPLERAGGYGAYSLNAARNMPNTSINCAKIDMAGLE
jgi:hypothetical protein